MNQNNIQVDCWKKLQRTKKTITLRVAHVTSKSSKNTWDLTTLTNYLQNKTGVKRLSSEIAKNKVWAKLSGALSKIKKQLNSFTEKSTWHLVIKKLESFKKQVGVRNLKFALETQLSILKQKYHQTPKVTRILCAGRSHKIQNKKMHWRYCVVSRERKVKREPKTYKPPIQLFY